MIVQNLTLYNFKNHQEGDYQFSSHINCFVGDNGVGKTSILDALHYLSMGKSFLNSSDSTCIMHDSDFFSIKSDIQEVEKITTIQIQLPKEGKKAIKKNEKLLPKLSDHIGFLPSVLISPYDSNLIQDTGDSRRRFLDQMISQTDKEYLYNLIQYQKTLKQRNALLKYFQKNRTFDLASLEIYNEPLSLYGEKIYLKRKEFTEKLDPIIQEFYNQISAGKETIAVAYESQLQKSRMESLLSQNLEKDRVLSYTYAGIHKDDLQFTINQKPIKKFGSQGQQKSFLIALKLAQIKRIKDITGKNPILLLDDIFDKLDDTRVMQLIELLNRENFGQMFITDTSRERTEKVVKKISAESIIFAI